MAVLSKPTEASRVESGPPCLIIGSGSVRERIATALAGHDSETPVLGTEEADELVDAEIGAGTILILVCDLDRAGEMATLRRLRRTLRRPPIIAVSPTATATGVRRALDAGADAIVFEPELELTLPVTVRAVDSGQSVVPRKMRASVERPAFSHRERQVLSYVSRGLTNAQIAEELFLSESTIKSHLSSAFAKFGVRSRREAAALFIELEQPNGEGATR